MVIAELIDTVWATRKSDQLNGIKFMLAEVKGGTKEGERLVVCDVIGAGIGDRVLVTFGSSARKMIQSQWMLPLLALLMRVVSPFK
jgi:ethanolamine utilization protein EutN